MPHFDHLSKLLRDTRNRFAACRHGGMVLTDDNLEALIRRLGVYVEMASAMEAQLNELQATNGVRIAHLVTPNGAAILHAMRDDSNVVMFRPHRSAPQNPTGGDAA